MLGPNGVSNWGLAVCAAALAMLGLAPGLWIACFLVGAVGFCWVAVIATHSITVQMSSPRWVTARTVSLNLTVIMAGWAAGSIAWGTVANHFSVSIAYIAAGIVLVGVMFAVRPLKLSDVDAAGLEPSEVPSRPTSVEVDPRAGPVVVSLQYRVPEANAEAFVKAAQALGLVRRRNGARRWMIMQDVDNPEIWVERYESPTWEHYQVRVRRAVASDIVLRERVYELGGEPQLIRRMVERPAGAAPLGAPREHEAPVITDPSAVQT
jgi:hypothetical protein